MKLILIIAVVIAAVSAQPQNFRDSKVLRSDIQAPVGANYRTAFETDTGINVEEVGSEGSVGQVVVRGSYSYTAPNGEVITINYIADENGYRAEGPSVPV